MPSNYYRDVSHEAEHVYDEARQAANKAAEEARAKAHNVPEFIAKEAEDLEAHAKQAGKRFVPVACSC